MEKPLTVGRLSEQTGLSRKSIRYYEQEKLIPKAARSLTGYRLYRPEVLERLRFIQKAKTIGFALADIRRILELTDKGKPCCDNVVAWSDRKLGELEEQIKFLSSLRKRLLHYRKQWELEARSPAMPQTEICRLIQKVDLLDAQANTEHKGGSRLGGKAERTLNQVKNT